VAACKGHARGVRCTWQGQHYCSPRTAFRVLIQTAGGVLAAYYYHEGDHLMPKRAPHKLPRYVRKFRYLQRIGALPPLAGEMRILLSVVIQALKDVSSPTRPIRLDTLTWLESPDCAQWCALCALDYQAVTRYLAQRQAGEASPPVRRWRSHG
jgi:hypothetical protein